MALFKDLRKLADEPDPEGDLPEANREGDSGVDGDGPMGAGEPAAVKSEPPDLPD